jgi:polygalacturonase
VVLDPSPPHSASEPGAADADPAAGAGPRVQVKTLIASTLLTALVGFGIGRLAVEEGDAEGTPPPADRVVCAIDPEDGHRAIAAAIEQCPDGTTVLFPPGRTYRHDRQILVKGRDALVIDGNGSTFTSVAPSDPSVTIYEARPNWELVEGTDLTLRNMTIRGNLPSASRGTMAGNQFNAGVIIYGGDGVFVTDVDVHDVFGEFVVANPSGIHYGGGALDGQVPTNVRITRLRGQNAARQCVAATAAQGFWLEDSTLRGCAQNGVDIEPDVAGELIRDVHIRGNTISDYYAAAIAIPTAYAPGDVADVEIRGNTTATASETCLPAIVVGGVQENDNLLMDIVVTDNVLKSQHDGIRLTDVGSGRVVRNDITLTAAVDVCSPPVPVPVRTVNSPAVVVEHDTPFPAPSEGTIDNG